jgi:hypothetical protein
MIHVNPRFHEFHVSQSFTFSKLQGSWFVSDIRFTFVLPGIFHLFQHDYFFHVASFLSGKVVRSFTKFTIPFLSFFLLPWLSPESTRNMQVMGFLLGKCRSFNSSPPRKDHHHASRDSRVDVDYMISVINHTREGMSVATDVPIGFRQARCVSAQVLTSPARVLPDFLSHWMECFSCEPSSRGVYRHALQEADFLARRCAGDSRSQTKPGTPSVHSGDLAGRGFPVRCPSRWTTRSNPGRCTRPNHRIRMLHDTFLQTGQARRK